MTVITFVDVRCSIDNMLSGKSCGPDGIAAETIKYGGELLAVNFVSHCYIPQDLTTTTIVPLLKNKASR